MEREKWCAVRMNSTNGPYIVEKYHGSNSRAEILCVGTKKKAEKRARESNKREK